jgi:hypothetical protein
VSTTATPAVLTRRTVPAIGNLLVAVAILAVFVFACADSAARRSITTGFDEPQHISFAAQIKATGNPWPPLDSLRLIDPKTFEFTATPNFLDHPPIYYALLAAIGPPLAAHPQAVFAYRMLNVALAAIGLAALLVIALDAQFSRPEFWALAIPLAFIPVLVQLAAAVTNDNMAFLGGALATLGAWQTVATGHRGWLALALGGVVIAAWAKLTGLVLTAPMISAVVAYMIWRKRAPLTWLAAAAFAFLLAATPYLIYVVQYGNPVPPTHALLATVEEGVRNFGWANLPRKSFAGYLMYFAGEFIANWMPTLAGRTAFQYAMLAIPVAALLCAGAGLIVSVRRVWRREETKLDVIVIAGALGLATIVPFLVGYNYSYYVATGWLAGAYPRYYLPLAAIVPLAGISLAEAISAPRWRAALLTFLIAGPVIFRILGAPGG